MQGMEITGFGILEPNNKIYREEIKKTCPLKPGGKCDGNKCAVWNDAKKRCGLVR